MKFSDFRFGDDDPGYTPGATQPQPTTPEPTPTDKPWTSDLAEIGRQTVAGATVELPKQIGQAAKWMSEPGKPLHAVGETLVQGAEERAPGWEPDMEGRGPIAGTLIEGARQLAPSMAPGLAVAGAAAAAPALGLPALGAGLATGIGAGVTAGLFGTSQAQETFERVKQAGASQEDALNAGRISGAIEGLGEGVANVAGMKLIGLGGKVLRRAASPLASGLASAADTSVLKPFAKQAAATYLTEAGTEALQSGGEAAVEQAYGVPGVDPWGEALHGAQVATGMTTLLLPFGVHASYRQAKGNEAAIQALADPNVDPETRTRAAEWVGQYVHDAAGQQATDSWMATASRAIEVGVPIGINEDGSMTVNLPEAPPPAATPPDAEMVWPAMRAPQAQPQPAQEPAPIVEPAAGIGAFPAFPPPDAFRSPKAQQEDPTPIIEYPARPKPGIPAAGMPAARDIQGLGINGTENLFKPIPTPAIEPPPLTQPDIEAMLGALQDLLPTAQSKGDQERILTEIQRLQALRTTPNVPTAEAPNEPLPTPASGLPADQALRPEPSLPIPPETPRGEAPPVVGTEPEAEALGKTAPTPEVTTEVAQGLPNATPTEPPKEIGAGAGEVGWNYDANAWRDAGDGVTYNRVQQGPDQRMARLQPPAQAGGHFMLETAAFRLNETGSVRTTTDELKTDFFKTEDEAKAAAERYLRHGRETSVPQPTISPPPTTEIPHGQTTEGQGPQAGSGPQALLETGKEGAAGMPAAQPANDYTLFTAANDNRIIDEEKYQRGNLNLTQISLPEGSSIVSGDAFAKHMREEAQKHFDASGQFIGEHKYRVVTHRGVYLFNDLEKAKEFTATFGQRKGKRVELTPTTAAPPSPESGVLRYQWMRNKEGGQEIGNREEIRPITKEIWEQHVRGLIRLGPEKESFDAYHAKYPDAHASLISKDGGKSWQLSNVGTLSQLIPKPQDPRWVRQVQDFESPEAQQLARTADSDLPPAAAPTPKGQGLPGATETSAAPHKTPGTNLAWSNMGEWNRAASQLNNRPVSSQRYKQEAAHLDELLKSDVIEQEIDPEALRQSIAHVDQAHLKRPHGQRAGTPYEAFINRVNNRIARLEGKIGMPAAAPLADEQKYFYVQIHRGEPTTRIPAENAEPVAETLVPGHEFFTMPIPRGNAPVGTTEDGKKRTLKFWLVHRGTGTTVESGFTREEAIVKGKARLDDHLNRPGSRPLEDTISRLHKPIEELPEETPTTAAPSTKEAAWPETMRDLEIASGEQLYSQSGRALEPAPKIDRSTSRKVKGSLQRLHVWLYKEAKNELESGAKDARTRDYQLGLLKGINPNRMSPADQDTLTEFLFGDPDGPTAAQRKPREGVAKAPKAEAPTPKPEPKSLPEPEWWTQRTPAERLFVLNASGVKGTAMTPWNRLSAEDQQALNNQWGNKAPGKAEPAETLAPNEVRLPNSPYYIYTKQVTGTWTWRVASAPPTVGSALKPDDPIIRDQLEPALTEKQKAAAPVEKAAETTDFGATWDAMGYSEREKLASKYISMRPVIHRLSVSKWAEISEGERKGLEKAYKETGSPSLPDYTGKAPIPEKGTVALGDVVDIGSARYEVVGLPAGPDDVVSLKLVGQLRKEGGWGNASSDKLRKLKPTNFVNFSHRYLPMYQQAETETGKTEAPKPVIAEPPSTPTENPEGETGDFGPILNEFHHDAKGAIARLQALHTGEAVAALHHPEVGDIDLVWGKDPAGKSEGYGLAKIVAKHPEVLPDLQGFLLRLKKNPQKSGPNRIRLQDETGHAVVSLDWFGKRKTWLLTAYEERGGAAATMDIGELSGRDDTARSTTTPGSSIPQSEPGKTETAPGKAEERQVIVSPAEKEAEVTTHENARTETTPRNDRGRAGGEGAENLPGTEGKREAAGVPGGEGRGNAGGVRPKVAEHRQLAEGRGRDGLAEAPAAGEHGSAQLVGGYQSDLPGVQRRGERGADYRLTPGELKREGGWKATAERNLDIIELLRKIQAENRPATPEEQAQLIQFTGWGASEIAQNLFPVYQYTHRGKTSGSDEIVPWAAKPEWRPLVERALKLFSQGELLEARKSTQYAHYTSEAVIRSMYRALERFGFTGGKVLEPGMGIGLFEALMPESMANASKYTGIEMDPVTAGIAKLLFPNQNVLQADFVKQKLPGDFFDAAIGNPPFARTTITDDPAYKKYAFSLHDYFFAKTIDKVRPGGLMVFVTSHYTMDKQGDKGRKYLAERADLLGAIRLPQTAFKQNAGTEVVTDVLFFKKREAGAEPNGEAWRGLAEVETPEGPTLINEYFVKHPEMVLGRHSLKGKMRTGEAEYTVLPLDERIEDHFAEAVEHLPEKVYSPTRSDATSQRKAAVERDFNPKNKKEGGLYLSDQGEVMRVEQGSGVPLESMIKLSAKDKAVLKDYLGLRDAVKQAQYDQLNDGDWEKSLKALNKAYSAFVKKHGPIQSYTLIDHSETDEDGNTVTRTQERWKYARLISQDVEGPLVWALERKLEDGTLVKAPFLTARTIKKPTRPKIETVADALTTSLDEIGELDLDHVAQLANKSREAVIGELGNLVYEIPGGVWQLADEYLSGDVVTKLEEAEEAYKLDERFKRNVEALREVQPKPLMPRDISVSLGAPWVDPAYITAFAREILGINAAVGYDPQTHYWRIPGSELRTTRSNRTDWGTNDRSPYEILDAVLNNRSIKITRTEKVGDSTKTYTDEPATAKVNELAQKMRMEFKSWVWTDAERAGVLLDTYNRRYNNLAPRRFDGSHLTLPGASLLFKLYEHQKRAIWRVIQDGNTYLAHSVGSGKTFEMIAAGMEMRRLGKITKPLYVVPKHALQQFANEFMELYPTANIMVATEENFIGDNRRRFVAQAALNGPDAIVISHPAFTKIGLSPEAWNPIVQEQIDLLQQSLDDIDKKDQSQRITRKRLEQRIEALQRRLAAKRGDETKDRVLTFEELGVDFMFVDEAHEFRKLDFVTNRANVKGITAEGSLKALDLYAKTRWLEDQHAGRSHVFASGTPVTNTMGELYTVMRFFDEGGMVRDGIDQFDAWATMFGEVVPEFEMNAAGRYEIVERFARFANMPELMKRVRSFMDVLTSSQLGNIVKRPDIIGGQREIVITPPSEDLKTYQTDVLLPRLEQSRKWKPSKDQPANPDPVINIITDGRLAAIDMRFVRPSLTNDPNSKLNKTIDAIIEIHNQTKNHTYIDKLTGKPEPIKGGAQIVFSVTGFGEQVIKNRGFNSRAWVMKRFKEAGIPATEVAWMSDYTTAAKKDALFKDMRSGKIRILIGSPKNMGTGLNVQKRLIALHYIDPPWYPSDVEQPEGRIVRQGNQNPDVWLKAYATKGSYDSTMWQMVSRKARFIEQAFLGDDTVRSVEDISEASQFAMASALSSGDERAIQLAGLKADVERYSRLKEAHANEQASLRWDRGLKQSAIKNLTDNKIPQIQKAIDIAPPVYGGHFAEIDGQRVEKHGEIGKAIVEKYQALIANPIAGKTTLGLLQGKHKLQAVIKVQETRSGTGIYGHIEFSITRDVWQTIAEGDPAQINPVAMIQKAYNLINGLEGDLRIAKADLERSKEEIARLNKRIGAPFEHEQTLAEKIAEAAQLERELAQEGQEKPADDTLNPEGPLDSSTGEAGESFSSSHYSRLPTNEKPAGLSVQEVQAIADNFRAQLRLGDRRLSFRVFADQETAFGNAATIERMGRVKGAYFPADRTIRLVASHLHSARDAEQTLRHEILAHFGLNLFTPEEKRALLDAISASRKVPSLDKIWQEIDQLYSDKSESLRAEEVFARIAEHPPSKMASWWARILAAVRQALRRIGLLPKGQTSFEELQSHVASIAEGIRHGWLQKTFPKTNDDQFSKVPAGIYPTHTPRSLRTAFAAALRQLGPHVVEDVLNAPWFHIVTSDEATVALGAKFHRAYHGSPNHFDKFAAQKIGAGEGTREYGFGLYFSDAREIADYYRTRQASQSLSTIKVDGVEAKSAADIFGEASGAGKLANMKAMSALRTANGDVQKALDGVRKLNGDINKQAAKKLEGLLSSNVSAGKQQGMLYEVELTPEQKDYLDWDRPLSEQSAKVQESVRDALPQYRIRNGIIYADDAMIQSSGKAEITGRDIYKIFSALQGGEQAASDYLRSLGVRGIRYLDRGDKAKGARNYVIFDDADIAIVSRQSDFTERAAEDVFEPLAKVDKETRKRLQAESVVAVDAFETLIRENNITDMWQLAKLLNPGMKLSQNAGILAFVQNGQLYVIADNIPADATAEELRGLILHEIGVHIWRLGRKSKEFQAILRQLQGLRGKDARVDEAFRRAELADASPEHMAEEAAGYLCEASPDMSVVKRIMAWFRAMLRKLGIRMALNPDDVIFMARSALRSTGWRNTETHAAPTPAQRSTGAGFDRPESTVDQIEDLDNPDILFSRRLHPVTQEGVPAAQQAAARSASEKIGEAEDPSMLAKLKDLKAQGWPAFWRWVRFGAIDKLEGLREMDQQLLGEDFASKLFTGQVNAAESAWVLGSMAKSAEGALETLLQHGALELKDGALHLQSNRLGEGLIPLLESLKGEHYRFLHWVIGQRAAHINTKAARAKAAASQLKQTLKDLRKALKAETDLEAYKLLQAMRGQAIADYKAAVKAARIEERLFTPEEIKALQAYDQGTMADGRDRSTVYAEAQQTFKALQTSVLDIAEEAGLIDGDTRPLWESEFYVPFYRVMDEDTNQFRTPADQLVRQTAFKHYKGSSRQLRDPLQNTIANLHHLLSASLRNQAAQVAIKSAQDLGIAEKRPSGIKHGKQDVWIREEGKQKWYRIEDPLVLRAVSALSSPPTDPWMMHALSKFRGLFTRFTTANPAFRLRNILRDSITTLGISKVDPNVFNNVWTGWKAAKDGTPEQAQMLTSGALFHFTGNLGESIGGINRKIADDIGTLNNPQKARAFLERLWRAYDEFGDRAENANRAALFLQAKKAGASELGAAFLARDLLPFDRRGGSAAAHFLITAIPFLNARMQGLDKLGRSLGSPEQRARMTAVMIGIALASAALYAAYWDDDDFRNREEWDRDTYWWFKIGDQAFRIPRPFELGLPGLLAERLAEQIMDSEAHPQLFADRLMAFARDQLAFNPIPQLVLPLYEIATNKDEFTGRAIESEGMQNLLPEDRQRPSTSTIARGLSGAATGAGLEFSPVQMDHLISGYFSWVGATVTDFVDRLAEAAGVKPERPEAGVYGMPIVGQVARAFAPDQETRYSKYVSAFYDQQRRVSQIVASYRDAAKHGRAAEAAALREEYPAEIKAGRMYQRRATKLAEINHRLRDIAASRTLTAEEKREETMRLTERRNQIAREGVQIGERLGVH